MKCLNVALLAMAALGGAACGQPATLSQEQATQAFALTSQVMTQSFADAQKTETSVPSSLTMFQLSDMFACQTSGSVAVTGTVNVNGITVDSDSQFAFNGCAEQGTTLDGQVSWMLHQDGSANQTMHYVGDISYSGNLSGSCPWDVNYTVSQSTISYSGTVCDIQISGSQAR